MYLRVLSEWSAFRVSLVQAPAVSIKEINVSPAGSDFESPSRCRPFPSPGMEIFDPRTLLWRDLT